MNPNSDIYLQSVFREQEAFSLPGVGTFRKAHNPARLGKEGEWILPPEIKASFDAEVDPDVLLSEQLVEQFGMPREEAQTIEAGIVSRIRQQLKSDRPYTLAGIGVLSMAETGGMQFSPSEVSSGILGEAFFGLEPVASPQSIPLPPQESLIHSDMPSSPSAPRRARGIGWKTFLIVLGLPILGIGLVRFGPVQIMSRQQAIQTPDSRSLPRIDEVDMPLATADTPPLEEEAEPIQAEEPAPTTTQPTQPQAERSLPPQIAENVEPAPQPVQEIQPNARITTQPHTRTRGLDNATEAESGSAAGNRTNLTILDTARTEAAPNPERDARSRLLNELNKPYHLIIGSFSEQSRAREEVTELKTLGYSPVVIQSRKEGKTLYRISIYRAAQKSEVEAFSARLRAQGAPSGWILDRRTD